MADLAAFLTRAKASTNFKTGFVKCCPIPRDDETGEPLMSVEDWLATWGEDQFMKMYRRGITQIASETATFETI